MNKALLAKLAWRVLTNSAEIWSKMLAKKYGVGDTGAVGFSKKWRASAVWRGLTWGDELLQHGLRWKVINDR